MPRCSQPPPRRPGRSARGGRPRLGLGLGSPPAPSGPGPPEGPVGVGTGGVPAPPRRVGTCRSWGFTFTLGTLLARFGLPLADGGSPAAPAVGEVAAGVAGAPRTRRAVIRPVRHRGSLPGHTWGRYP